MSYISNSKSNTIITGTATSDTIDNGNYYNLSSSYYGSNVTINAASGNDFIYNKGLDVFMSGGTGNDSLFNSYGKRVTIDGADGNDDINNYGGSNVSINGGKGKDTIGNSWGNYIYIYGGDDNDIIDNWYSRGVTISGGKGNDTIELNNTYSNSNIINYLNGDGKDVIVNYTAGKDKIRLTSGSISNSKTSGKDVILTISSGSIIVKNAAGKKITVVDSQGKETSKVYGTSLRNYVEKLWFNVDDNYVNDEINAISQSNMNSIENISNAVGKITTYDANTISNNNSPDLVFVSNLTKKK